MRRRTTAYNNYRYNRRPDQAREESVIRGSVLAIGLGRDNSEPMITDSSTAAEHATLHVIGDTDYTPMSKRAISESFLSSIDEENDPAVLVALKQITAQSLNRQQPLDVNCRTAIETLDPEMNATNLRDFLIYVYEMTHGSGEGSYEFMSKAMRTLSGFRVEASFLRLATRTGFNVQPATKWQDNHGIDFIIDGVPLDIKSSLERALYHASKHHNDSNRVPTVKFIPPITAEDFANQLVVPYDRLDHIIETTDFHALVNQAITQYRAQYPISTLPS